MLAALGAGAALGIVDHLRRRFARFELCAHLLDLLGLLFETRNDKSSSLSHQAQTFCLM